MRLAPYPSLLPIQDHFGTLTSTHASFVYSVWNNVFNVCV